MKHSSIVWCHENRLSVSVNTITKTIKNSYKVYTFVCPLISDPWKRKVRPPAGGKNSTVLSARLCSSGNTDVSASAKTRTHSFSHIISKPTTTSGHVCCSYSTKHRSHDNKELINVTSPMLYNTMAVHSRHSRMLTLIPVKYERFGRKLSVILEC